MNEYTCIRVVSEDGFKRKFVILSSEMVHFWREGRREIFRQGGAEGRGGGSSSWTRDKKDSKKGERDREEREKDDGMLKLLSLSFSRLLFLFLLLHPSLPFVLLPFSDKNNLPIDTYKRRLHVYVSIGRLLLYQNSNYKAIIF